MDRDSQPDYEAPALHQPSNYTDRDSQRSKPSATHKRLIGELGLRYRPSAQADLEDHATALALLTMDVADIPAHLLELAIRDWVRESHFMPKASDLIALAKAHLGGPKKESKADLTAMNQKLLRDNIEAFNAGVRWHRIGESLVLGHPPKPGTPCTAEDARRILKEEGCNHPFLLEILASIERTELRN